MNIVSRVHQHITDTTKYKKEFTSYKYIEIDENDELNNIEQLFIVEYQPLYNRNSLGYGKYPKTLLKENLILN